MLKEKLNKLKSKDYNVTEISVTTILHDQESVEGLLYFSKPIYEKNTGFSNKYTPTLIPAEEPSNHISRVETRLEIEFSIDREKINNLKTIFEPKPLLKKITNEIIDLLKINCYKRNYYVDSVLSEVFLYTHKNSKKCPIIIRIHLGNLNFRRESENTLYPLVKGEIHIIKEKDINRYF